MGDLGDEFQFSFVLPTKSLQRVVTSINGKMTQLILCTKQNTNFISNNDDNLKSLTVASKDVVKVLKSLSESVKESIQTKYKNDVAAVEEIEEATQNLIISAENLHLSSQMLLSMSRSLREVETHQSCDLVSSISKVFQNLTILLICMDNAETRSIIKLCRRTHQSVANMITSKSLKSFTQKFDLFGVVAEEFYENVNKRCSDLLDSGRRGKMENYLSQFKHTISMLVTSFSIAVKYPHNREAQSGVDFAYNQMSKAIQGLMNIIESRQLSDDLSKQVEVGIYPQLTSSIERILSVGRRTNIDDLEALTKIQSLVQHYIALITLVKKNNLPVHGMAQNMIEDVKKLTERGDQLSMLVMQRQNSNKTQQHRKHHTTTTHNNKEDDHEMGEICRNIRAQLKQLSRNAKHLVTSLFAQTFVVTTEPLEALLNHHDNDDVSSKKSVQVFTRHTDDVLVACKMVANCCESADNYQEIDCCVKHLKAVTSQLTLMTYEDDGEGWVDAFNDLFVLCASCLDLRTLVSLILKELIKDFETVHVDIVNLSECSLSKNVIRATGRSKLLTEIGKAEMRRCADMSIRNTILPLIKQTEQATLLTVANSNHLLEDIAQMSAQEDFISSTLTLKDCAKKFSRSLLNCTANQQLTSEQPPSSTTGIRDFNDTALVVGLVHEISNLQNKLSTVGISETGATSQLDFNSPSTTQPPHDVADQIDMLLGTSGEHVVMESDDDDESTVVKNSQFVNQLLDVFNKGRNKQIDSIINNMVVVTDLVGELNSDIEEISNNNQFTSNRHHHLGKLSAQLTESVQMLKVAIELPHSGDTPTSGYNINEEVGKYAGEWEVICGKIVKMMTSSSCCDVRDDDVVNMRVMTSLVDDVMTLMKRRCQYNGATTIWSSDEEDESAAVVMGGESFINLVDRFTQIHKKIENMEEEEDDGGKIEMLKSEQVAILKYLHLIKFNRIKLAIDDVIEGILKTRTVKLPPQEVLLSTDDSGSSSGNQLFMYNLRLATISQWLADVIRTSMMGVGGTKLDLCISKVKKAHIRCDVTKKGIEETIKLILRLDDDEKMGLINSRVCSRFEYLHRRFMLEISRLYLFAKSITTLKTGGNPTTQQQQQLERSGNYELNSTALFDSTKDFIKPSATSAESQQHEGGGHQMEDELVYLLTSADILNEGISL